MKKLYKYRYEIFALFLFVAFFTVVLYLNVTELRSELVRVFYLLYLVADGALLYITIRKLWRVKWRTQVEASVQKALAKLAGVLMSLFEKWNGRREGNRNVLAGNITVSFELPLSESKKLKVKKPPKWKQLQTDRERLRYLYLQMICERIKRGDSVYACDTPLELKGRGENNAQENELFDMYNDIRYDDRAEPDEQTVLDLKERLFDNLK